MAGFANSRFHNILTSNGKGTQPLLLSPLILPLDTDPLVNSNPLSSLNIKVSDHVDVDGGESIVISFIYTIFLTHKLLHFRYLW